MQRRTAPALIAVLAALGLVACGSPGTAPAPAETDAAPAVSSEPEPSTPQGPTEQDLLTAVAGSQWSYAPQALLEPVLIDVTDGAATDDLGRMYTVGEEHLATDLDDDGILDLAVTIDQLDGNGYERLWYAWIGAEDGTAAQIPYPLARSARCGDAVRTVSATETGLRIDGVIYDPSLGVDTCAEGSTERFSRDIEFREYEGALYPVQVAPTLAWGGHCPRSSWQDGESLADRDVRVAPPVSSEVIIEQGTAFLPLGFDTETPLLAGGDVAFFAFMPIDGEQAVGEQACAFALFG